MPRHAIVMVPSNIHELKYNLCRPGTGNLRERSDRERRGQHARDAALDMFLKIVSIDFEVCVQLALTPGDCLMDPRIHASVADGHHAESFGQLRMHQHSRGREDFGPAL